MGERGSFSFETWRQGRVFFTADLHLGHERIIGYCARPFDSLSEMNTAIIDAINTDVGSRDTLVVLGDVVLGYFERNLPLLTQIKAGKIWILPGNHDRFSLAYRHTGAPETQRIKRGLWRMQYESMRPGIRCEPDLVPSSWTETIGGRRVLLSHYPYEGDSQEIDRHRLLRPRDAGLPLLHGHVHERWRTRESMFNMGVDVNQFRPVPEGEIADWLSDLPMGMSGPDQVAVGLGNP